MGIIQTLMSRWSNAWTQRVDCYNGRHKMKPRKFWCTDNWCFTMYECKRCKVRKTVREPNFTK